MGKGDTTPPRLPPATPLAMAYADACAVITRPMSFVEWKMYALPSKDPKTWGPFGVSKDRTGAYKAIDKGRELYIYVFRQLAGQQENDQAVGLWVEELHVLDGNLSAANVEPQLARLSAMKPGDPEPKDRPKLVPIGKTVTLARRINGRATKHYFFASRIRLPLSLVGRLQLEVIDWAPAHTFEPDDLNAFADKDGGLLVPVLEPLTIALHLHGYYEAAAKNCIEYSAGDADGKAQRQTKVLLAYMLQSLINNDKTNTLYYAVTENGKEAEPLTTNHDAVEEFVKDYESQCAYRRRWRDRWNAYLTNWLDSRPFQIAQLAHATDPKAHFAPFFVIFCRCLGRLSEGQPGRDLLMRMYKDEGKKWTWVNQYIFPQERPAETIWEIIEKTGGSSITAMREWSVFVVAKNAVPASVIVTAVATRFGWKQVPSPKPGAPLKLVYWEDQKSITYNVYEAPAGSKTLKPFWVGCFAKAEMVLKLVSAAFAVQAISEAFGEKGDAKKRAMAVLLGAHVLADVGKGATELVALVKERKAEAAKEAAEEASEKAAHALKKGSPEALEAVEHSVAKHEASEVAEESLARWELAASTLGFIASLTDVLHGTLETIEAFDQGERGKAVGSLVSTVGYGIEAGACLWPLLVEGASGGPVGMIGAFFVVMGDAIKMIYTKSDHQIFLEHSYWGESYGEEGPEKEWAVKPFPEWKGRFDLQLQSLIQLLCQFEIEGEASTPDFQPFEAVEAAKRARTAKLKMGWLPSGAHMEVSYEEVWNDSASHRQWTSVFEVGDKGEIVPSKNAGTPMLTITGPGSTSEYKLELAPGATTRTGMVNGRDQIHLPTYHPQFHYAKVKARLLLESGNGDIHVPFEESAWKEQKIADNRYFRG